MNKIKIVKITQIVILGLMPIFLFVLGLLIQLGLVQTEELEFFEVNGFILMNLSMILLLFFMSVNKKRGVKD